MTPGMKDKTYQERLTELRVRIMSLEQRYSRQNLLTFYNVLNKNIKVELDGIMEIIGNEKTRGNTLKKKAKVCQI